MTVTDSIRCRLDTCCNVLLTRRQSKHTWWLGTCELAVCVRMNRIGCNYIPPKVSSTQATIVVEVVADFHDYSRKRRQLYSSLKRNNGTMTGNGDYRRRKRRLQSPKLSPFQAIIIAVFNHRRPVPWTIIINMFWDSPMQYKSYRAFSNQ